MSNHGRIKRRIFGEYRPGPQVGPNRDYTRILITPDLPIDQARPYPEDSPHYKFGMNYVQLQSVPTSATDKIIKI